MVFVTCIVLVHSKLNSVEILIELQKAPFNNAWPDEAASPNLHSHTHEWQR
jgi:hypothetical protein